MGFLDWLWNGSPARELETRQVDPDPLPTLEQQITDVWHRRYPWGRATVRQALSVPAVFKAVSLLSNTGGSLPIDVYRNGELVPDNEAPAVVRRPDPLNTPRSFKRNTIFNLACWGNAYWWIAARDFDGLASSLINLHPPEVRVTWDRERLRPRYEWRDRDITGDIQHLTFMRFGDEPYGFGPLQLCGSVMSAAAEATEWAARFMAEGGIPSVVLDYPHELTAAEANALKAQWVSTPSNMPKVTSGGLKAEAFQVTPADAQLLEVREQSASDIARMFGLNAYLLNVPAGGSSLTYQNVGDVATELLRLTLGPNYLVPIEEALTDLLPRTTAARFNVEALQRADVRTRYETYASGITSGVLSVDEARAAEFAGLAGASPPNRADRVKVAPIV